jgi:hypothetical protein
MKKKMTYMNNMQDPPQAELLSHKGIHTSMADTKQQEDKHHPKNKTK